MTHEESENTDTSTKGRNLVIFSDGTGNRAGKGRGTNVWQMYEALDRTNSERTQLAVHDDGVGSNSNTILATLGGAFGFGLAQNVRELYAWLCTKYESESDRIYLVGFSRGAFTIRCLAGMIAKFGIIEKAADMPRSERERWVQQVWFALKRSQSKSSGEASFEKLRPWFARKWDKLRGKSSPSFHKKVLIEFVGVWDTVDAYGLPFDELKDAFALASRHVFGIWPLRYLAITRFNDRKLSPQVLHACHALAIDDERHTFHPVLWDEITKSEGGAYEDQTIDQVWFSGVHSDVGGGYVRRSLSLVPLNWMMVKAYKYGLRFDTNRWDGIRNGANPLGPMHDSRSGLSSFYRYRPRDVQKLCQEHNIPEPTVHSSVLERVDGLNAEDAPGVLPTSFGIEPRRTGTEFDAPDRRHESRPDQDCIDRLRVHHRRRGLLYLVFVGWAAILAAVLYFYSDSTAIAPDPGWKFLGIGYFLSIIERFTPATIGGVVQTLRGIPFYTLLLTAALLVLRMSRSALVGRIRELRRAAWDAGFRKELFRRRGWSSTTPVAEPKVENPADSQDKEYEKWTSAWLVVAVFVSLLAIWGVNWYQTRTLFPPNIVVEPPRIEYGPMPDPYNFDFMTNNPAHRVGPVLQRGERYEISVEVSDDWFDIGPVKEEHAIPASPTGLDGEPTPRMKLYSLARRDLRSDWFVLLGSLGSENGEIFEIKGSYRMKDALTEDTRLYLFVNDATCYWCPTGPWTYYKDNKGVARVTIRRVVEE